MSNHDLIGKKFPVLDQGWIIVADVMGTDATICDRARGTTGGKGKSSDRELIRLMLRKHHGSSFEFPEIDIQICCPFVVWRQMIRHRAGNILDEMSFYDEPSVNELSGRYSEVPEIVQETAPSEWRKQSKSNRQGSSGIVSEWPNNYEFATHPEGSTLSFGWKEREENPDIDNIAATYSFQTGEVSSPGDYLSIVERKATDAAKNAYRELLHFGVAKEQARKVWPMGGYTIGFMKMDLRNWLHWAALRMAPGTQEETRAYANVIGPEIIAKLFPTTWVAFKDYVLEGMTLSAIDLRVIKLIMGRNQDPINEEPKGGWMNHFLDEEFSNGREREECRVKLIQMGLIPE